MKRSLLDFLKKEYEVRLSIGGRDTVAPSAEQWFGVSAVPSAGAVQPAADEDAFSMILAMKPRIIRFSASDPQFTEWLERCKGKEIYPHVVFPYTLPSEQVEAAVKRCTEMIVKDDHWEAQRFYEIECLPENLDDPEEVTARLSAAKEKAEGIRALDPEAKIILSGIAPIGDNAEKAGKWNIPLVEKCAQVMDLLGVSLMPSVPSGRIWDTEEEGIEANSAMAEQIRLAISRLETEIFEAAPDAGIRIALTGWSGLQDGVPQKRQDCTYYASVYRTIRMACRSVALNEAGPLFGPSGLLSREGGVLFGNVFYLNMAAAAYDLPLSLWVNEADAKHPSPTCHWECLPGCLDETEIKMLEAFASSSEDGKQLFIFLINRSPFKQALARISFYDIPPIHPAAACSIRSRNRLDENSAEAPEKVFCKQIRLEKYRDTDHVTLEIPACGCAWLLLES